MERQKTRVLVVEDNREMCDILQAYFLLSDEVEVCGFASDGEEALHKIRAQRPEVVLLDLIMPKADGISVLERLRERPVSPPPSVIVTSAIGQEQVTMQALKLGACYYMIKPYQLSDLLQRILMMAPGRARGGPAPGLESRERRETELAVAREVIGLGVPTNLLGYGYVIAALRILLEHGKPVPTAKEVYAAIAEENGTTRECVESAIRKTIQRIHEVNNESYRALMRPDARPDQKPSNAKFLSRLAEKLRQERGWQRR